MSRKVRQRQQQEELAPTPFRRLPPLKPRTPRQAALLQNLTSFPLTFAVGPAGVGKTYLATRHACQLLLDGEIERIIVSRPMVTAGEDMGFLPGKVADKFAPFFGPVREIMVKTLGLSHFLNLVKNEKIEIAPIAHLRGHTLENCFVLLDEAQNLTPVQMKMFLTRMGENSTLCVSGDLEQTDLPGVSGLARAVECLEGDRHVAVSRFDESDVVRSALVRMIVKRFRV